LTGIVTTQERRLKPELQRTFSSQRSPAILAHDFPSGRAMTSSHQAGRDMELSTHGSTAEKAAARLRIVEEHLRRENAHDLAGIIATFGDEAAYGDTAWGEHVGRSAVEQYYRDMLTALPDLRIDVDNRFVTDDAVVLQVIISGTHNGPWRGLPATGRAVQFPLCGIFRFTADGMLASETIYYDRAGVLHQVGLYHEPDGIFGRLATALSHPVTLLRAYARKLMPRSSS
jgi:steroid delta-isomerase-like uncharacterized protein